MISDLTPIPAPSKGSPMEAPTTLRDLHWTPLEGPGRNSLVSHGENPIHFFRSSNSQGILLDDKPAERRHIEPVNDLILLELVIQKHYSKANDLVWTWVRLDL